MSSSKAAQDSAATGGADSRVHGAGRLFRRYLLWVGASVFTLMVANGIAQSYFVWRDTEAALQERHRRIADAAARRTAAVLDDAVAQMKVTLRQMDGVARIEPALRQQELHRLLRADRMFGAVRLTGADGTLLAQAGRLVNDAGLAVDERSSADAALPWPTPDASGEAVYGAVFLLQRSQPRVRAAMQARARRAGDPMPVLAAELSLEALSPALAEGALPPGATLYLVDPQQRVIAHSQAGRALAALGWQHLHPRTSLPAPGATLQTADDAADGAALLTSAAVPALKAVLVLDQARSAAWQPVRESILRSLLATAAALLLAVAAAALLARRMNGLFTRLAQANERIQEQATRLATMNSELAQRRDEAERANRAKTRFIAAASHDLRQPLHAVALLSDVLHRRLRDGEDRAAVAQLQEAVGAMDRLFQGILDLSKLDAGAVVVQREAFAPGLLLERIAAQAGPLADAQGVTLRVRRGSGAALGAIDSDPVLLERILLNLVGNAIRYTATGGKVLVGCRRRGAYVRIAVWDTGIGIAPEQKEHVFEEFVQLHNPQRGREQGLGLGLSVVRRVAGLLSHPIGVHSEPGRGSCFYVDVPMAVRFARSPRERGVGDGTDTFG